MIHRALVGEVERDSQKKCIYYQIQTERRISHKTKTQILAAPPSAEALRAATRRQTVERSAIILSFHLPTSTIITGSSTPRSTTWLSAPARQGQRGNPGLDEEALAGGLTLSSSVILGGHI